MDSYLVSYDLRKPGRNYDELYDELKSFANWAHPLESLWVVVSEQSSTQIRDRLWRWLDENDGLLVVKSSNSGAWIGLSQKVSEWLKEHL